MLSASLLLVSRGLPAVTSTQAIIGTGDSAMKPRNRQTRWRRRMAITRPLLGAALAMSGRHSLAIAQDPVRGTWRLQKIEQVLSGAAFYGQQDQTVSHDLGKRDFTFSASRNLTGDAVRSLAVKMSFPALPQVLKTEDWLFFDLAATTEIRGPGPDTAYMKFDDKAVTSSGYEGRDFMPVPHKVAAQKVDHFDWSVRNAGLITFPREDFIVSLRVTIDDGGPLYSRATVPVVASSTVRLYYKWMGSAGMERPVEQSLAGRWSGAWTNTKGDSGTSTISLNQDAYGNLTGDEAGWAIENGRRDGNVLTWQYRNQNNGCTDYSVRLEVSADGKTANGTYQATDRCRRQTYSGTYRYYHRMP